MNIDWAVGVTWENLVDRASSVLHASHMLDAVPEGLGASTALAMNRVMVEAKSLESLCHSYVGKHDDVTVVGIAIEAMAKAAMTDEFACGN